MWGSEVAGLSALMQLFGDGDVAAGLDVGDVGVEGGHGGVAAGDVGVADVEHEGDAGGDGVDGAGVDGDGADGGYGVDAGLAGGFGGALAARVWRSTERMSSAAAREGVAAVGHEEGAGVAAEAGDLVAVAGGGGDVGDDAEGMDAFAFEQRALLDVEFDPGVVVVGREGDGGEGRGEAGGGADCWRVRLARGFGVGFGEAVGEVVGGGGVRGRCRGGGSRCSRCRSGWALRR